MPTYTCDGCENRCKIEVPKGVVPLVCVLDCRDDDYGVDISNWDECYQHEYETEGE